MSKHRRPARASLVLLALAAPVTWAQVPSSQQLGLFVYPAKGQPAEKQRAEETECYGWAKNQSGIDPTAPPPVAPPPEQKNADGSALKGAAAGAAVGTAVGAIVGETGEGAAIGAVTGALRGRRAKKQKDKQEQQAYQQQTAAQQAQVQETFKKAYGACLEGKGYTVK
jgi:Glycine zipper